MVVIPDGTFQMGSSATDGDDDERPQHLVKIPKAIGVSISSITFLQWEHCVTAGACTNAPDEGWGREDRPVINVSWADAKQYVSWLSRTTGKDYRLLTEAEWEYAARAGNLSRYTFGDDEARLEAFAWFEKNSTGKTQPVAKKRPNKFGLYDMHGNVWQWVEDCAFAGYIDKPKELMANGGAWTSPGCRNRVVRGGSWANLPNFLRSANRNNLSSDLRYNGAGFRIARTLAY
jgi:formylglycine-generating enzyme required for sulfatase activity